MEEAYQKSSPKPDMIIIWTALIIAGFGVLMIYDASAVSAALRIKFQNSGFFFYRQLIWFLIGSILMLLSHRFVLNRYQHLVLPLTLLMLTGMILVLIPGVGHTAGGARRWIKLGPLSIQPGELMRLVLAIYLAHLLSIKRNKLESFKDAFLPAIAVTGITVVLLAAQPKYGSALILVTLAGIILFAAGIPMIQLLTAVGITIPFIVFAVSKVGYIQGRIASWLNPALHARGAGFQMMQSLIAIGSGGITGAGLGQGRQKIFYLPEAHTDMIFPVIAEELGLIGAGGLLCGFGIILFRGLRIAKNANSSFGKLLAVGLTFSICIPASLNFMVATGLFPVTGIALPLVSFGGTALITDMVTLGLLAGIPLWAGSNTGESHELA